MITQRNSHSSSRQEQPQVFKRISNGQSVLSPSGHPQKSIKRTNMSSISSAEDDMECVRDKHETMNNYESRSPANLSESVSLWQDNHMDPGTYKRWDREWKIGHSNNFFPFYYRFPWRGTFRGYNNLLLCLYVGLRKRLKFRQSSLPIINITKLGEAGRV